MSNFSHNSVEQAQALAAAKIDENDEDGLRSGNEIMVGPNRLPNLDVKRNFNENDILGDLDRDKDGNYVMHEEKPKSILCGLSARSNKSKSDLLDN